MVWYKFSVLFITFHFTEGFLLDGRVTLRQHLPKLPQFVHNGKSMVLVGGNLWDNNTDIYDHIIHLAGGKGLAKIGIITAASDDAKSSFKHYMDVFISHGVLEANRIPIDLNHTADNADQATIDLIYNQTGFFFGEGNQDKLLKSFLGVYNEFTPALIALHQMYDIGAVIAGNGDAIICLTNNLIILSGKSFEALVRGPIPEDLYTSDNPDELTYKTIGGLVFMKGYVLDAHCSELGREGRVISLLEETRELTKGTSYGIGIDENTALVVTHADSSSSRGEVVGTGGVSVFDLSNSTGKYHSDTDTSVLSSIYLTYLTNGDSILLTSRIVDFSFHKSSMLGHELRDNALISHGIFNGTLNDQHKSEFVKVATSIFDAKNNNTSYGDVFMSDVLLRVNMDASNPNTLGWVERKGSFNSDIISYQNLELTIVYDD